MHTCPRRAENGMDDPRSPLRGAGRDLDDYTTGHGIVGQSRGCTYCGSMHPEDFMDAVRTGAEIGPTDKSYKVYVKGYAANGTSGGKFYTGHLTPEQAQTFKTLYEAGSVNMGYPGYFYAPLYLPLGEPAGDQR